ncbi:MAG: 3-hydroxyacyl-CoA dehydrogenase family protein, partial [Desulfobacterales bacterium]
MGAGIARAIFKHGFEVRLFDLNKQILDEACQEIKQKARRNMNPDKIIKAGSLKEAAEGADLIIEAVVEEIDIKCKLFAELGKIAPPETIFASNTSSLSISRMASASGRKDRFVGLHFFNPPVIMRLIEVIVNNDLSGEVYDSVMEFIQNIKKTGVKCKESPGFVVNRILIPIISEAFYLLEEKFKEKEVKMIDVANDIDSAIVKDNILFIG